MNAIWNFLRTQVASLVLVLVMKFWGTFQEFVVRQFDRIFKKKA